MSSTKRESDRAKALEEKLEEIQSQTDADSEEKRAGIERMCREYVSTLPVFGDDPNEITSVTRLREQSAKSSSATLRAVASDEPYLLVVDDDHDILDALGAVLRDEGYLVYTATDARIGINVLHGMPRCDCVLLDLMMPEYPGWAFLDFVKHTRHAGIPLLIISAVAQRVFEQIKIEVRSEYVFTKPINLEHLLATVRAKILERRNG